MSGSRTRKRKRGRGHGLKGQSSGRKEPLSIIRDVRARLVLLGFAESTEVELLFCASTECTRQFELFSAVSLWCFTQLTDSELWTDWDDANTVANRIVRECKSLGFSEDFAAARLRDGYGFEVCSILDFLTQLCLRKSVAENTDAATDSRSHRGDAMPKKLQISLDSGTRPVFDLKLEHSDDDVSDVDESDEESDYLQTDAFRSQPTVGSTKKVVESRKKKSAATEKDRSKLKAAAAEWRREYERLKPELESAEKELSAKGGSEWQSHWSKAKAYARHLDAHWPALRHSLECVDTDVRAFLSRVRENEAVLRADGFAEYESKHRSAMAEWRQVTAENEALNEDIENATAELEFAEERLKQLRDDIQTKRNHSTDTGALHKRRESLRIMNKETKEMDLQIGLLLHTLTHARIKAAAH